MSFDFLFPFLVRLLISVCVPHCASLTFTVHFSFWSRKNFSILLFYRAQMALVLVLGVDIINVCSKCVWARIVFVCVIRDAVISFVHWLEYAAVLVTLHATRKFLCVELSMLLAYSYIKTSWMQFSLSRNACDSSTIVCLLSFYLFSLRFFWVNNLFCLVLFFFFFSLFEQFLHLRAYWKWEGKQVQDDNSNLLLFFLDKKCSSFIIKFSILIWCHCCWCCYFVFRTFEIVSRCSANKRAVRFPLIRVLKDLQCFTFASLLRYTTLIVLYYRSLTRSVYIQITVKHNGLLCYMHDENAQWTSTVIIMTLNKVKYWFKREKNVNNVNIFNDISDSQSLPEKKLFPRSRF